MSTPSSRGQNLNKRKEERACSNVRRARDLDALQIEEYIATNVVTNRHNRQRNRQTRKLLQTVLSTAHLLRAAGVEADGNDTAGKVKLAIAKLTKDKARTID
jgi:hypothetical protein